MEEHVTGEQDINVVTALGLKHRRPLGVSRGMSDGKTNAHKFDLGISPRWEQLDVVWFGQLQGVLCHGQELLTSRCHAAAGGVGEPIAVVGVDQRWNLELTGQRGNTPNVVHVTVRE